MKESLARVKVALPNGFCTLPLQNPARPPTPC